MTSKRIEWAWGTQLLHAPDTRVRMVPVIVASVSRAVDAITGTTLVAHTETVFNLKDARVTVNVHVER